ncbi:MAG: ABC transporter ATP-binding protein [Alphaproteobacteria bacterium]
MTVPALAIRGLVVRYGEAPAVDGLDLAVAPGEVLAVLGPNGAGKSTLIKAAMGLVDAAAGSVHVAGTDVSRLPAERRARAGLGYVPEGRRMFPGMTVRDNLLAGARGGRAAVAQRLAGVEALLPALAEKAAARAWTLSGGQQQMVAIGRALMTGPRVLLLDEPSLGLSPALVGDVMRHVARIAAAGTAVLLAEQNARAALAVAGRAVLLRRGRIAESAPADAMRAMLAGRGLTGG